MVRHETVSRANRRGHEAVPACGHGLLEVLFLDRDATGGVHVTQDAILRANKVRMGIETGVEESNTDVAASETRISINADRCRQELLLIAGVYRKRREQLGLERGQAAGINSFFNSIINTFQADTIFVGPVGIILA